jgi:phosphoribosylaminoimidazolecarboxamide formyltransferase/IMP cyclohydrolase
VIPIRRALLSVSDKTGLAELARELVRRDIEILSTGGTQRLLEAEGITTRKVSSFTGFPEILDGRVKTLHPKIHGGLLGRRGVDDAVMAQYQLEPIDLLVVNLYPFAAVLARADASDADAIENIDVGGPAMLRAAAKNHEFVTVVVDPADYARVLEELKAHDGATTLELREQLAAKAFAHTAEYDTLIARFLGQKSAGLASAPPPTVSSAPSEAFAEDAGEAAPSAAGTFPETLSLRLMRAQELRYGENPHQRAALYRDPQATGASIPRAQLVQGPELSFNNIADADAALECVRQLTAPACVIVKHMNPCGAAEATSALEAYERAYRTDPTSAFGGILALNCELDTRTVQAVIDRRQFVEVLIAPSISEEAQKLIATRPRIRLLITDDLRKHEENKLQYRSVTGGLLAQTPDEATLAPGDLKVMTLRQPTEEEIKDLLFAWRVCQYVKSNAIVYARDRSTIGIGAGQMSRVYSSRLAAMKASDERLTLRGAVMASDAFFPFRDGIDVAAEQGIRAVIQPGGARRDAEIIEAADGHGMAMVFTGIRHFRH